MHTHLVIIEMNLDHKDGYDLVYKKYRKYLHSYKIIYIIQVKISQ